MNWKGKRKEGKERKERQAQRGKEIDRVEGRER